MVIFFSEWDSSVQEVLTFNVLHNQISICGFRVVRLTYFLQNLIHVGKIQLCGSRWSAVHNLFYFFWYMCIFSKTIPARVETLMCCLKTWKRVALFLPLPLKVERGCFHPCLSVCEWDISKSYGRIRTKLGGHVGYVTRKNRFDFGEDPNLDPILFLFYFIIVSPRMSGDTMV